MQNLYSDIEKKSIRALFQKKHEEIIEEFKKKEIATFHNSNFQYYTIVMNTQSGETFIVEKEYFNSTKDYIVVYRSLPKSLRELIEYYSKIKGFLINSVECDKLKEEILDAKSQGIAFIFEEELDSKIATIELKEGRIIHMSKKRIDLIKNPKNVKEMAYNLRELCDRYWERSLTEKEFEKYLNYYFENHGDKIFKGEEFRRTIEVVCGEERLKLFKIYM